MEPRWDRRDPEHRLVRWALFELADLFALVRIGGWPTDAEHRAIQSAWPENNGGASFYDVVRARESAQRDLF